MARPPLTHSRPSTAPAHGRRKVTAARRRGGAQRLRAGLLALVAWLAVAAAHAQTASAPGQVGAGTWRYDKYAPGDHQYDLKWVFSHPGMLEITWRPPSNDGGSAVTGYRVYWYQTGNHAATVQSADVKPAGTGVHVHYVTGLTNGTEYGVGVTAVNAVGEGPFRSGRGAALAKLPYISPRDDAFINVPAARSDMQVGSLAAARSGANAVRLTWSRPTGSQTLDYYKVSWARAGSAVVAGTATVAKTATSHDLTSPGAGSTGSRSTRSTVSPAAARPRTRRPR